jgi:hypothetical protein
MFQAEIEKHFEVKVLYFLGSCISMGIFSQLNSGDCLLDYRIVDSEEFLRLGEVNLPGEVEDFVVEFMKLKGLSMGVLDFIVDLNGECVFLEVNPRGNFHKIFQCIDGDVYKMIVNKIKMIYDQ